MDVRAAGVLLHISSLPSAYGVGDLGPEAYAFADWLHKAGQRYWQILPLNPTSPGLGNSPYSSFSAFAGYEVFISPEIMVGTGLLMENELEPALPASGRADFDGANRAKHAMLKKAFDRARPGLDADPAFQAFRRDNAYWLEDYALFMALKERFGGKPWIQWPEEVRDRRPEALDHWRSDLAEAVEYVVFCQHVFFDQWGRLRKHLEKLGIEVIGDAPIYVTHDSTDVWVHRELFKLDPQGISTAVAGVPPDYFSATGQLWGNPVYDWQALDQTGYDWWHRRLRHIFGLFDWVRLDHFRGFAAFWQVPAGDKTAENGEWIFADGEDMLAGLESDIGRIPLIAEDLGVITGDVIDLKDHFGLPGMKVLQFAWGGIPAQNRDIPFNHEHNCVVYTGTHDNTTTRAWFDKELDKKAAAYLAEYLGLAPTSASVARDMIRLAYSSPARTAVAPIQDWLGLGPEARMNVPSVADGNWSWKLVPGQVTPGLAAEAAELVRIFGRDGSDGVIWDDYEDPETYSHG